MNSKNQVDKSLWVVIQRLKNDSLTSDAESFIYDASEDESIPLLQQQKVLKRFAADGIVSIKPLPDIAERINRTMGNTNYYDTKRFEVTLLQPVFDESFEHYRLPEYEAVTYRNSVIKQGERSHVYTRSPEHILLIQRLWQNRRITNSSDIVLDEGKGLSPEILKLDMPSKVSVEQIKSLCDSFNKQMKRSGIHAKISKGKYITLSVTQDNEKK